MEATETLEKLVRTIMSEAEAEAAKIIAEAENEKARIIKEAQEEAERRRQSILRDTRAEEELSKRRELARTGLQIRMEILATKERMIEQAFAAAMEKLQTFTKTPEYASLLEHLIIEGTVGLGGGDIHIQTNHNDALLLHDLQKLDQFISNRIKTPTTLYLLPDRLNCSGGVLIKKADGSIMIDNTFEAKVARQRRELRLLVSKILFED
ncbi:MAG: V-type ATP synthase subunit E [Candidatus Hodarchaeota archaeon]